MTDLQTSLIAIGGTILVAVVVYNKWQEFKARKSDERLSAPSDSTTPSADAATRHEPSFASIAASATVTVEAPIQAATADEIDDSAEALAAPIMHTSTRTLPVDGLLDCIIPLIPAHPLHAEKILAPLQTLRHVGHQPVHFIGQRADGEWEAITHGGVYKELIAGVQLANRSSVLNEIDYSELVAQLRALCDTLELDPEIPDMALVMQEARKLHQFASGYDAQLGVNILANKTPWVIDTLLTALERQGFDLRLDGRLVMPDGDGGQLFSLSTNVTLAQETSSRLTLLLDVPRVAPARGAFNAMTACARSLAGRLDGTIVDDSNQPLTEAALAEIANQVDSFYADMENAGIPAGSTRALRLFN